MSQGECSEVEEKNENNWMKQLYRGSFMKIQMPGMHLLGQHY